MITTIAQAEPIKLTDTKMDKVTAGFVIVAGAHESHLNKLL